MALFGCCRISIVIDPKCQGSTSSAARMLGKTREGGKTTQGHRVVVACSGAQPSPHRPHGGDQAGRPRACAQAVRSRCGGSRYARHHHSWLAAWSGHVATRRGNEGGLRAAWIPKAPRPCSMSTQRRCLVCRTNTIRYLRPAGGATCLRVVRRGHP